MTAEQRAGLSDAALAMTQPCIDELIKDISRRVQKAGAITDTAEYQLYRAQALGESKKAIEQAVSKQIGISEEVIASLFEYVADKSLSLDENGSLKRMTEAYTRMTQSKTRELLPVGRYAGGQGAAIADSLRPCNGFCFPAGCHRYTGLEHGHPPRRDAAGEARPAHH